MPARLENELQITQSIETLLKDMPSYVVEWHDNLYASKKTASTRKDFIRKIGKFLSSINNDIKEVKCSEINAQTVTKYYITIATKTLLDGTIKETSGSYQQNIYSALKNFLGFLAIRNYIERNYMIDIDRPKSHDLERIKKERIKLKKEDFKLVLDKANLEPDPVYRYRNSLILKILMETGMRETALRIINISDIDFDNKTLVTIDKGKGGKFQVYPLNDSTIETLKKWLKFRKYFEKYPRDALFLNYQGERLSCKGISRIVDKYFQEALGKHVSPHKIRGGVASILYEQTGDIEFVRRALDHEKTETTQRYITTENNERDKAAQLLEL